VPKTYVGDKIVKIVSLTDGVGKTGYSHAGD
jgi:hypothetical protein